MTVTVFEGRGFRITQEGQRVTAEKDGYAFHRDVASAESGPGVAAAHCAAKVFEKLAAIEAGVEVADLHKTWRSRPAELIALEREIITETA